MACKPRALKWLRRGGPDQGPTSHYETGFCFAFVSPTSGCFPGLGRVIFLDGSSLPRIYPAMRSCSPPGGWIDHLIMQGCFFSFFSRRSASSSPFVIEVFAVSLAANTSLLVNRSVDSLADSIAIDSPRDDRRII